MIDLFFALIIVALLVGAVTLIVWLNLRILKKAGYSDWWTLTTFIPIVNFIAIWVFAFAKWPNLREPLGDTPDDQ